MSDLVRESTGSVEPERIEVVTPDAINEKWIEMYGEPSDGQLRTDQIETQAREAEFALDGFVKVG